jgi:hypothetical protein
LLVAGGKVVALVRRTTGAARLIVIDPATSAATTLGAIFGASGGFPVMAHDGGAPGSVYVAAYTSAPVTTVTRVALSNFAATTLTGTTGLAAAAAWAEGYLFLGEQANDMSAELRVCKYDVSGSAVVERARFTTLLSGTVDGLYWDGAFLWSSGSDSTVRKHLAHNALDPAAVTIPVLDEVSVVEPHGIVRV